jgi:hypothetical protein
MTITIKKAAYVTIILTICLIAGAIPVPAFAADGKITVYEDKDGAGQSATISGDIEFDNYLKHNGYKFTWETDENDYAALWGEKGKRQRAFPVSPNQNQDSRATIRSPLSGCRPEKLSVFTLIGISREKDP